MPILSRSCEYALQALLYIASKGGNVPVLQRDISKALQIRQPFLGKILQSLSRHNLVISQKGRNGGFALKKAPSEIFLYDIVVIMDGPDFIDRCVLGFPNCSDSSPCPVHGEWKKVRDGMVRILKKSNLQNLSRGIWVKLNYISETIHDGLPVKARITGRASKSGDA